MNSRRSPFAMANSGIKVPYYLLGSHPAASAGYRWASAGGGETVKNGLEVKDAKPTLHLNGIDDHERMIVSDVIGSLDRLSGGRILPLQRERLTVLREGLERLSLDDRRSHGLFYNETGQERSFEEVAEALRLEHGIHLYNILPLTSDEAASVASGLLKYVVAGLQEHLSNDEVKGIERGLRRLATSFFSHDDLALQWNEEGRGPQIFLDLFGLEDIISYPSVKISNMMAKVMDVLRSAYASDLLFMEHEDLIFVRKIIVDTLRFDTKLAELLSDINPQDPMLRDVVNAILWVSPFGKYIVANFESFPGVFGFVNDLDLPADSRRFLAEDLGPWPSSMVENMKTIMQRDEKAGYSLFHDIYTAMAKRSGKRVSKDGHTIAVPENLMKLISDLQSVRGSSAGHFSDISSDIDVIDLARSVSEEIKRLFAPYREFDVSMYIVNSVLSMLSPETRRALYLIRSPIERLAMLWKIGVIDPVELSSKKFVRASSHNFSADQIN